MVATLAMIAQDPKTLRRFLVVRADITGGFDRAALAPSEANLFCTASAAVIDVIAGKEESLQQPVVVDNDVPYGNCDCAEH